MVPTVLTDSARVEPPPLVELMHQGTQRRHREPVPGFARGFGAECRGLFRGNPSIGILMY